MPTPVPPARPSTRVELPTVYASGLVQGIALVSFPAAAGTFLAPSGFGLTSGQYGLMFAPQVVAAITAALLGGSLSHRFGIKRVYLWGLSADAAAMALLAASQLIAGRGLAYPTLLLATACLGVGFGLTVPALNAMVAGLRPDRADSSILLLNALLGAGTALAPVFVAVFTGLGFWWGLPLLVVALLAGLLTMGRTLPLDAAVPPAGPSSGGGVPRRFWLFAAAAAMYGICETLSGNWSGTTMTGHYGASATVAALALTAFWGMVTVGRLAFAFLERFWPARWIFRLLPLVIGAAYLAIGLISRPGALVGVLLFALAGLGCSALLPSIISFGQHDLTSMSGSASGGVVAFYQVGYAVAAFAVAPLVAAGIAITAVFLIVAIVAAAMMAVIFGITRSTPRT